MALPQYTSYRGAMTQEQLGKYIKGWIKHSLPTIVDQNIQNYNPLAGMFPSRSLEYPRLEVWHQIGNPGVMDVALSDSVDQTRYEMLRSYAEAKWQKYAFMISDEARTTIAVDDMAARFTDQAMKYFGTIESYKVITELKAKYNTSCTHAAGTASGGAATTWQTAGADLEGDIIRGIEGITRYSGIDPATAQFGLIYPSKAIRGTDQLQLIHNVQQTIKTYLKSMWDIQFVPYTPYKDAAGNAVIDIAKGTSSDALGNDAVLFVKGNNTLQVGVYQPGDIPLAETERVFDKGYRTVIKRCMTALAVPMYDTAWDPSVGTGGTTPLIYKISSVSS